MFLVSAFMDLLYPPTCAGCDSIDIDEHNIFCLSCAADLPFLSHDRTAKDKARLIFQGRVDVEHVISLFHFHKKEKIQKAIYRFKYGSQPQIAEKLGEMLGDHIADSPYFFDYLIPVPLHWTKRNKRGYNQCEYVSNGVAQVLQRPILHALRRAKMKKSQTYKSRLFRIDNVQHIFEAKEVVDLNDKHILLIDDVLTTGATFEACIQALQKRYPRVKVSVATIAIGDS